MWVVAVPADAYPGAQNLPDARRGPAEGFDFFDGLQGIVREAKRGDTALAFELAKLKG
jgi:hypothetical protein